MEEIGIQVIFFILKINYLKFCWNKLQKYIDLRRQYNYCHLLKIKVR